MLDLSKPTIYKTLQVAMILSALAFAYSNILQSGSHFEEYAPEKIQDSTIERNERSTPRSFILPATPAVAFEQEAQMASEAEQKRVDKCAGALLSLGYDLDDSTTILNAKLVEAVYSFQKTHNLTANGRLDQSTMEKLNCL